MSLRSNLKEEGIQVLMALGLTSTQSKAYLALCQLGKSPPKTISKISKIARQDVYRVLAELQELGLAKKTLARPALFEALPLKVAIETLMKRRTEKGRTLQAEIRRLLLNFEEKNERTALTVKGTEFVLIPNGKACLLTEKKAIRAAQECIEYVTSYKRFLQIMLVTGKDIMEACNRGVKFRVIMDRPENQKHLPKIVDDFYRNPLCKIRYILLSKIFLMACFDKKELLIGTLADAAFSESTMLWSDAPSLVSMAQDDFEITWITAIEDPLII